MKKAIDINERTLEQEKKGFISVCKIGEAISIIMLTLCLMGAIALPIIVIFSLVGLSDSADKYTSPIGLLTSANAIVALITYIISSNFAVKVFNKLKDGESPFRYEIADKIKAAGITLVIGGCIFSLIDFITTLLVDFEVIAYSEAPLDLSGNLTIQLIFGVVLMALAYIFNYGCKLQQESDETV